MKNNVFVLAKKELSTYFSSPIAFIFLCSFLAIVMFIFFWVEHFFVRNIVDVRPLFEWMPLLLIFLISALTMKMWSEERRMGTIEFLLTVPLKTHELVAGKFLSCMGLVIISLVLTLGVPITVSFMGDLDWGPVIGAYTASLLLASSYVAIGLFVSSKNNNQIVSLILSIVLCFIFFLPGTETITGLAGNKLGKFLNLISTGSRFNSITRGVLDFRDLYYYLSLTAVFLTLNIYSIEKIKWSTGKGTYSHKLTRTLAILFIINFLIANFWINKLTSFRTDLTKGNLYSISDATKNYIKQLREPLLIRGYFSAKTHPLLAPLVPRVQDMITEYGVVSNGKIRTEIVDPKEKPDIEQEASQKYNIKPVPFQISDKYQASVVNSYFDILIQYGDQYEVLNFEDLIEIKPTPERKIDVKLRNLEYDITKSIKKVMYGFQTVDSLFETFNKPAVLTCYISKKDKLPPVLKKFYPALTGVLDKLKKSSKGKFSYKIVDPDADRGKTAKFIKEKFGFQPMVSGLFNPQRFYFYMVIQHGDKFVQVQIPENMTEDGAEKSIENSLTRLSPGFLKVIGILTPPIPQQQPWMRQYGMPPQGKKFNLIKQKLSENYRTKDINIKNGIVPNDIDLLLILAPKDLTRKEIFAIDQFLMKGGTVILATSPFEVSISRSGVFTKDQHSALEDWLKTKGIEIEKKMVLDPQNEQYPIPVQRNLGFISVQEIKLVNYPFFVDIRDDGMKKDNHIVSGIPQVTFNWSSPIKIDKKLNKNRKVINLLQSSEQSWTSDGKILQPDFKLYGKYGFKREGKFQPYTVAAVVEGEFNSYFKGKDSPLLPKRDKNDTSPPDTTTIVSIIEKSPDSAKIILFSSNEFLADQTLQISRMSGSDRFMNSLQLVENSIDWSLEDPGLLSIRSRGLFSRTLKPMTAITKKFFEYLNYGLILIGIIIVFIIHKIVYSRAKKKYEMILQ